MKLLITKSKWEAPELGLEEFLRRTAQDEYDGTELFLPGQMESANEIVKLHRAYHLKLVAQIITEGPTPDAHLQTLEERFRFAVDCQPLLINSHTGRDIFSFDENCRIFERALELSEKYQVLFVHETHRGRPFYSAIETRKYLEKFPELKITADFSHWMTVHESDLSDQQDTLALAMQHARHIHARVGHAEGPQVADPRAPEYQGYVRRYLELWQMILDAQREKQVDFMTMTPEFGPPPYMPTLPFTNQPVGEAWEINAYMRKFLRENLRSQA